MPSSGDVAGRVLRLAGAGAAIATLGAVVVTPLGLRDQALFGVGAIGFALLLRRSRAPLVSLALAGISIVVSTRYLVWRFSTAAEGGEQGGDFAFGLVLLTAELYAFVMLVLGHLQTAAPLPRRPVPLPEDTARWPTVDVFIPTYNEPLAVVRTTVLAARLLDWPTEKLRIWLLDDGRREAFRAFAAEVGVGYLTRPDNRHAKAGNLNHALKKTRAELIAIFDCDHVPTRSFLQCCTGWFLADPKLALVQTPHHFYSPDPFEKNLAAFRRVPNEGELFYRLIQRGNDLWNAAFFCGSCAVIRRDALEEVGGIAVETVTEDAHTALRLQRRGWSTAYLDVPQAAGLATESLSAHVGQRIRWARGMVQIFRIDNPLLGPGQGLAQRLCYAASMLHFLGGLPRLVFLVSPLAYLLFGLHVFNAKPALVLAYALPHLVLATLVNAYVQGRVRHSFWSEVYETALAFYISIPTTVALLTPRHGKFNVTAKGARIDDDHFDTGIARPYLVLLALNGVGLASGVVGLLRGTDAPDVVGINLLWTLNNLVILGATLAVAWERRQRRAFHRVAVRLPAMLRRADGSTVNARTDDLSPGGARLTLPDESGPAPGSEVMLSLLHDEDEVPLPARVVGQEGRTLRLRFEPLTQEEESALVGAIFSRADAWTRWADGRPVDRPLAAFAEIAGHGVSIARRLVRRTARANVPTPAPVGEAR